MGKSLIVQKYGGSSVADTGRIKNVANRIARYKKQGHKIVVVVSALGDTTDELLELAGQITDRPSDRELDMLISTGEQVSVALLAMALHKIGIDAISFTGPQVGIVTDCSHTKAKILKISADRIREQVKKGKVVIVAGFQGMNAEQEITTLGRGGSDLTAVAIAKTLDADMCEIYTDVEGVYTADPRVVKDARKLSVISYEEMLELASLGAQVMQARSIEVAKKYSVPLHIRSSFTDKEGTIISKEVKSMEEVLVSGVTANKGEAKVTICDVPDRPGIAAKIFASLAKHDINVDMIIQNISRRGYTDLSFTVPTAELNKTKDVVARIVKAVKAKGVVYNNEIAKVSIVGVGMKTHSGVAAKMFGALASKKINIDMISTSEIKISCVINKKYADDAVRALHKAFGLKR
ncbi:MAG: aspartate kinase [Omnitrophica bacterium GWA2_41_15]|nr:MAG: aspartate kinase [Omnitrophica bacterium GWA2_41_15]HAZ10939.1 aspartate kinase [Candidatus Omnitrophota bacterium]